MQVSQPYYQQIPQELVQKNREGGFVKKFYRSQVKYGAYVSPHHSSSDTNREEYLGRIVNEDDNVYYNKKWGFFRFTIKDSYTQLNNVYTLNSQGSQEFCSLCYGNIWLLHDLYHSTKFSSVLENLLPFEADTLHVLLAYKLTTGENTFVNVDSWFQRSYAQILYPHAAVSSGSISAFLKKLGENSIREKFFDIYHDYLKEDKESDVLICNNILIDSTGAQNDIKIPITRVSNHNGLVNNEFRVIYVVDHERNLPIYMNQVPGNVVDISTLKYIINLLIMRKIKVKCCVLDAGYYSDNNLEFLDQIDINYLVRMCNNRSLYKYLIEKESIDLNEETKYRILYRQRYLHCKKIVLNNDKRTHYAYIVLDFDKQTIDRNSIYAKYTKQEDISKKSLYMGKFILYSNYDIEESEVLNFYYTREHIEQVFDVAKNNGSMLPLRTHRMESTMGHLLLSFIATILSLQLNNRLKDTKYCATSALRIMNNLQVHVNNNNDDTTMSPLMPSEKELAIILNLNLDSPVKVDLSKEYTNEYLNKLKTKRNKGRPKGRNNRPFSFSNDTVNENIDDKNPLSNNENLNKSSLRRGRPKGSLNKVKKDNLTKFSLSNNPKRKRGRPKGSLNKPKSHNDKDNILLNNSKHKRGRPIGSKNKPKV
ncbi:MAG: transposase [Deltaproteobacteria bacterium]|jgi:hypothetical protein|nr:transposase [Deltaproteobacteria bacterium]